MTEPLTFPDVPERVARGAALLDEMHPDWPSMIIPEALALESCKRCVLGQMFGDFNDAPDELQQAARELGFDIDADHLPPAEGTPSSLAQRLERGKQEYIALTEEWLRVVAERRA